MNYREKVIFITGASSGIGEALVRRFAKEGAWLVLLARRRDRLEKLVRDCERQGARALAIACDVTDQRQLEMAVEQARTTFGKIEVVIANAGFGVAGAFEKLNLADYRRQFETNVFGLLGTVYATLNDLKRSRGQLVLLGSVAGYVSLPGSSPYAMSKFAVRALAEALVEELRPSQVAVTLISPGFVDSEIRKVDNHGVIHDSVDPIPSWIRVSSERAAEEIFRAVRRRKREQIVTGHAKVILAINRYLPWVITWVKGRGLAGRPEPRSHDS